MRRNVDDMGTVPPGKDADTVRQPRCRQRRQCRHQFGGDQKNPAIMRVIGADALADRLDAAVARGDAGDVTFIGPGVAHAAIDAEHQPGGR